MEEERFAAFNRSWAWAGAETVFKTDTALYSNTSHIRDYRLVQYFLGSTYTLIILLSLIGNLAVILAVIIFEQLKTLNHYLLMSLATADLTVTILVMPFALIQDIYGEWGQSRTFCLFWMSWDVMCCTASLQHLCAVAWDRYVAISDPYNYNERMTMTKVSLMIFAIWLVSALISFLPIFMGWFSTAGIVDSNQCFLLTNRYYAAASALVSFYLPFGGMSYCYYKIFAIVRQKIAITEEQQRSLFQSSIRAALLQVKPPNSRLSAEMSRRVTSAFAVRDLKATKTLGLVFGMFFFCWWPFFIVYWIDAFMTPNIVPQLARSLITWLGYLNSGLNPIIYSWNPVFRAAYKQLFTYMTSPCSRGEGYGINSLLSPSRSPSDFAVGRFGSHNPTRNPSGVSMNTTGMPTEEEIRELELIFWPPQRPLFSCRNKSENSNELLDEPRYTSSSPHLRVTNDCPPTRRRSYAVPGEYGICVVTHKPSGKSHEFEDGMEALLGNRMIDASKYDV